MSYSALIGKPTSHSVSHVMYGELAIAANLPQFYQHIRIDVEPEELERSLQALKTLHFIGLNVTLPYKLEVMQYVDELDTLAENLGAVNAIKLAQHTVGYNTDWAGITESVKQFGGHQHYETATIFGTGGAARAAIYACKQLGIDNISVVYRAKDSGSIQGLQKQSMQLGITLYPYSEAGSLVNKSRLIINATSAGMVGKDRLPFDLALIKDVSLKDKVFLDAVFNPLKTPLLAHFKTEGAATIDGLWMMIYQGIKSLSIWFDAQIDISTDELTKIHNLLEKEIEKNV